MRHLRYVLLVLTGCALLVLCGAAKVNARRIHGEEIFLFFALGGALLGNFIYLLSVAPENSGQTGFGRIGRLIRLWFDAKEADLKNRAGATTPIERP
jgi:hypothetical protein